MSLCPVAVICNMAFEMEVFRKEIQTFKGVEFLVKVNFECAPLAPLFSSPLPPSLPPSPPPFQLAQTPDTCIVLQALGGLLNMTVSESMRELVGKKGAVKVAMGKEREGGERGSKRVREGGRGRGGGRGGEGGTCRHVAC